MPPAKCNSKLLSGRRNSERNGLQPPKLNDVAWSGECSKTWSGNLLSAFGSYKRQRIAKICITPILLNQKHIPPKGTSLPEQVDPLFCFVGHELIGIKRPRTHRIAFHIRKQIQVTLQFLLAPLHLLRNHNAERNHP